MATLAEYSGTRSREENVLVMDEAGVTFAPVLSAGDLVDPPYARGSGLFAEVEEGGQRLPLRRRCRSSIGPRGRFGSRFTSWVNTPRRSLR